MTSSPLADAAPGDAKGLAVRTRARLLQAARPVDAFLLLVLFWGYDALCALRANAPVAGLRHARWLDSGLLSGVTAWERSLNAAVAQSPLVSRAFVHIYDDCHYGVTMAVIVWLCVMRPALWPRLRRAMWVIMAGALVIFYCCPVAPLRLLPGFVDIAARADGTVVDRADPTMYAAVPSLHVAWACWCAAAVVLVTRTRWRWAVVAYPVVIGFVVVATANHALVDVVTGATLATAAVALTFALSFRPAGGVAVALRRHRAAGG